MYSVIPKWLRWPVLLQLLLIGSLIGAGLLSAGCGSENSSSSSSEGDDDDDDDDPNPPVGEVDNDNFWVSLYDSEKFSFHMHKKGSFTEECEIPAASTYQSVECVVDVTELDLYFHEQRLHYNVPTNMCTYFRVTPFYFYNQEIGYGPATVDYTIEYDSVGSPMPRGTTSGAGSPGNGSECTIDGVGPAECTIDPATAEFTEVNFALQNAGATCVYDHQSDNGPNCCLGEYKMNLTTIREVVDENTWLTTSTTIDGKWGERLEDCIGGVSRTSAWNEITKKGYPASLYYFVFGTGLNNTLNLRPMIEEPKGITNMTIANYYDDSGLHAHFNNDSKYGGPVINSNKPYAMEPIDDRSGTPMTSTSDAWHFECLDEGQEVINEVKVYFREWDAYVDYLAYISSSGATSNPDLWATVEDPGGGGGCLGISIYCNDRYDFDDIPTFLNGNAGSYDQSSIDNIKNFFPRVLF